MDKRTNNIVTDYVLSVSNIEKRLLKSFVFGSFARKTENSDSDIDIAFIFDNLNDDEKFDIQVNLLLLASKYDTRIEPHILSTDDITSGDPFAMEILRTGIEIYLGSLQNLVD